MMTQRIVRGGVTVAAALVAGMSTGELVQPHFSVDRVISERKAGWLAKAEAASPKIFRETLRPVGMVKAVADKTAFQGVRAEPVAFDDGGRSFILDFGRHLTGYLSFKVKPGEKPLDHPLRLRLFLGETISEVSRDPAEYTGRLSRAWIQDEIVNVDFIPGETRLPRRYAFRYVRCEVVEYDLAKDKYAFDGFTAEAVTSADTAALAPFDTTDGLERRMDEVAVATLRDCMQEFFEDGPKRDRRLWLGDMRIQALVNYETFRNYELVKRCLYYHAALSDDDNMVRTDLYTQPTPHRGHCAILDFISLYAPAVLDYLDASGDRATAEDLWPIALKQLEVTLADVDTEGRFGGSKMWCFIDWDKPLDRHAPEQGAILYGLKRTIALAERLGRKADVVSVEPLVAKMEAAARKIYWDESRRLFVCGENRQVSMASQIWLTLAGAVSREEARDALLNAAKLPDTLLPKTPYLYTYWIMALDEVGLRDEARRRLKAHWGGMVERGADTFWEAYDPKDDFFSPYGHFLINSHCHAFSCGPSYFLRRWRCP